MKITVVIGKGGQVVGTAQHGIQGNPQAGDGGPVAGPGQSAQVIDMPAELQRLEDVGELHKRLKTVVRSR